MEALSVGKKLPFWGEDIQRYRNANVGIWEIPSSSGLFSVILLDGPTNVEKRAITKGKAEMRVFQDDGFSFY